jgi:hypothetical protein
VSLHPTEGIRVRLSRQAVDASSAIYTAEVFTPTDCFAYRATLTPSGDVELAASGARATDGDEKQLKNIAASMARDAGRNATWPSRITRWRGPGRGPTTSS